MGEKNSSRNQTSRKERKARKRAAEDLIPDIPVSEPELSSSVNEEKFLDKKANTTDHDGNKKRKRKRGDEEEVDEEEDRDGKKVDKEESDEKKKRKRSKKQSNKESKVDHKVDNNTESAKRDIEKKDVEEASVKDEEEGERSKQKKKKEKGKEHKTKKNRNLKDVMINDEEKNSSVLDQESTSQGSKKERKAKVKTDAPKPGNNNDGHDKESGAKVGTNTNGKETSKEDDTTTNLEEKKSSKTKKDKKKKTKLPEQPEEPASISTSEDTSLLSKTAAAVGVGKNTSEIDSEEKATTKSGSRFIVFVGKLPYTATTASITSHFSKLKPVSVRHLTKKDDPSKSRGIAFVEFENYDTHKTALKIMHHSIFDDGKSEPRMINVELTAGGGGNTEDRKAKIKSKNERLNEQRTRRKEEEEKAKIKKEEEKAKLGKAPTSEAAQSSSESNIHPSRRRMITA